MADASIWSTGIEGPPGPPGQPAILRLLGDWIQWSVQGTDVWTNLVPLEDITGPQGVPGLSVEGPQGPPGESVQGIPGDQGIQGIQGIQGVQGFSVLSSVGTPSNGLGVNGDFCVDLANALFWGPKSAGIWSGTPIDLRGGASGVNYGQRAVTNNAGLLAKTAATDPTLVSNTDYTQVTAIFEAVGGGINRGVTQQVNSMTVARAGAYEIMLWASLSSSVNNTEVAFKFAVNGAIGLVRRPRVRLDVANNVGAVCANGFVTLAVGDVVTLWLASTTTANIKIIDAVFSLKELR